MKKPEIFKPRIEHDLNNNKNAYYSFIKEDEQIRKTNEDPVDTLDRLIKSNSYIFNKKVLIVTKEKEYLTKIAGKIGKKVITIDGDSINIDDIIRIEEIKNLF